jgi:hypothetical protein
MLCQDRRIVRVSLFLQYENSGRHARGTFASKNQIFASEAFGRNVQSIFRSDFLL